MTLDLGPVETMLLPTQANGATSGEVMAQMPGMPMPVMTMTDQGQPVNRHLEVHLFNKTTGAVLESPIPTMTITDAMGKSRKLASVTAMYGAKEGTSDWHFGNNVYLPDGTYTISVQVGNEQATFKDVPVTGGTAPAPMATPTTMPKSGGMPIGLYLALGVILAGTGYGLRRRTSARS